MNYYNNAYPPPYGAPYGAPNQPPQYQPPQYQPPQYQPPPYYPPVPAKNPWTRPVRRNANIACAGLVMVYALSFFTLLYEPLSQLFISAFQIRSADWLSFIEMFGETVSFILVMGIPVLILKRWIGIPAKVAYPMRRPRISFLIPALCVCLGSVVLGTLLSGSVSAFMQGMFGLSPIWPDFPTPVGIPATILYFLNMTAAPAILEEMLFRGVIMQSLRRFGDTFALVTSAILFSLAHHNLIQGPNALVVGIVMGYFVLRTGSLLTGMIIHFVNNALAVGIDLFSQNLPAADSQMLTMLIYAGYALIGLAALVYLLVRDGNIFRLVPSNYPVTKGKKFALFFTSPLPVIYVIFTLLIVCTQFERIYV